MTKIKSKFMLVSFVTKLKKKGYNSLKKVKIQPMILGRQEEKIDAKRFKLLPRLVSNEAVCWWRRKLEMFASITFTPDWQSLQATIV